MARLVSDHIPAMLGGMYQIAREVTLATAGMIAEQAAASMEGQKPPSAPGHAPAIRSGLLHDGIKAMSVDSTQSGMGAFSAIAYTDVEYAQHLEYGTVHMEARPFMVPAAEVVRPSFEKAMRRALRTVGR